MVVKGNIEKNLKEIDASFKKATDLKEMTYFSKLAILELCGWLEMSMDEIVLKHSKRCLKLKSNLDHYEKSVVNRTYGFEYEKHWRGMVTRLVGLSICDKFDAVTSPSVLAPFEAELETLRKLRNQLAHTYTHSVGQPGYKQLDSPSVTLARLPKLHAGLQAYDRYLRSL